MQPTKKLSPVYIALIVIVLVGITIAAVVVSQKSDKSTPSTSAQSTDSTSGSTTSNANSTDTYKDGTYTETGKYASPGGAESIEVTLTIANNVITDATVTGNATRGDAEEYQSEFIAGYKSSVVGKEVNGVSLSRVAGSSLTSNGFNTALDAIKADAKA